MRASEHPEVQEWLKNRKTIQGRKIKMKGDGVQTTIKNTGNMGCLAMSFLLFVCGFFIAIAAYISMLLFEYNLWMITGKDIPWYGDLVGGLVLSGAGGINVFVAIACWIIEMCGVATPFLTTWGFM